MPTINEQIDKILDMRLGRNEFEGKGHLQEVIIKIAALEKIRESVAKLLSCKKSVDIQVRNRSGEFYKALYSDHASMTAFNQLDCVGTLSLIDSALDELRKLQKRFEREAVRIAFIGYERQGKSTFLQSMTGLPNEVIPAYDGTSCTGAVSVIHNEDTDTPFRAEIEFYSVQEFLDNVKAKLKLLMSGKSFVINTLDDLNGIDVSDYSGDDRTEVVKLIQNAIIGHKQQYGEYLGKGKKIYTDKDKVMKFVAQYREYTSRDSIPADAIVADINERTKEVKADGTQVKVWRHMYYWYLAVKSVNIYCKFPNQECGRIEFVDTVGLGPSVNADAVEKEMFRVLMEDCDGAIDVFCPAVTGGTISDKEIRIFKKIKEQLAARNPKKWMSYAINAIPSGPKCNIQNIEDIKADLALKDLPFGFYQAVDAANREDVNNNLLVPHLTMIAANLVDLDQKLINTVSEMAITAVDACQELLRQAMAVIPVSAVSDWKFERDGFQPMLHDFNVAMNKIDHDGYAARKDEQCSELTAAYENLIQEIDRDLPSEEELVDRFMSGNLVTTSGLFEEVIEEMRNGIFDVFEDINQTVLYPLQEKVKKDLIRILYEQGLMSRLPLPVECKSDEPTVEWLECIIATYVPKDKYPSLHDALRYILDYRINIEGLVEYNVTKSLHIIEKDHPDFLPYLGENPHAYSEKGNAVWQQLASRLLPLQKNLRSWIGEFALIPSQSFYSRVHKFHVKIGTNVNGVRDFKEFYSDNMGLIWHVDIERKAKENAAFSQWTECIENLRNTLSNKLFNENPVIA